MRIYKSVSELTGRTPLMELKNIEDEHRLCARVLAKLELFNPAGSTKDRVARQCSMTPRQRASFPQAAR